MSARIDEYHGADTKVLTTEEAKVLPEQGDEDGGMPGVVLVDRDDLLATTRALDATRAALKAAQSVVSAAAACDREAERHPSSRSSAPLVRFINAMERLRYELAALGEFEGKS